MSPRRPPAWTRPPWHWSAPSRWSRSGRANWKIFRIKQPGSRRSESPNRLKVLPLHSSTLPPFSHFVSDVLTSFRLFAHLPPCFVHFFNLPSLPPSSPIAINRLSASLYLSHSSSCPPIFAGTFIQKNISQLPHLTITSQLTPPSSSTHTHTYTEGNENTC